MTLDELRLAEATRALHESAPDCVPIPGHTVPLPSSNDPSRLPPRNDTLRIIEWCRAQPFAHTLVTSLQQARHRLTGAFLFALAIAAILGAGATRTALSGMPAPYSNVFLVLLALLGVQFLALLIWAIAFLFSFRSGIHSESKAASLTSPPQVSPFSNSISRSHGPNGLAAWFVAAIHPLLRWMARHTSEPATALAAWQTLRHSFTVGNSARWNLSALTHSFWLAFNAGALVTLLLLLSTRHVTFVWETTLLSEPHYIQLTQALGTLPSRIGFPTPSPDVVADSRWQGPDTPSSSPNPPTSGPSGTWSRFILGSLIVYGIIPRAILLFISVAFQRHNRRNHQLDLSLHFYQTLLTHLEPVARRLPNATQHNTDPPQTNRDTEPASDRPDHNPPNRPVGNPAIVGIELPPHLPWPPSPSNNARINWLDLGNIESGQDHRRALDQLAQHPENPSDLVIITDLNITPDRGIERSLRELHAAAFCTPLLVLTGGHVLRLRATNPDSMRSRIDSWTQAAKNAGLDPKRIIEIDLEHLTDVTRQRLIGQIRFPTQILPTDPSHSTPMHASGILHDPPQSTARLSVAFGHITDQLRLWLKTPGPSTPTIQQQAALQLAIARLHNAPSTSRPSTSPSSGTISILQSISPWPSNPSGLTPSDLIGRLPAAVQGVQSLLPASLRSQARWGIAGAIAGSVGCLAAAALVHPMALAALPSWSAWGAALGTGAGILRNSKGSHPQNAAVTLVESKSPTPATLHSPIVMDGIRAAALYSVLLELQGTSEEQITARLDLVFNAPPDLSDPEINLQKPDDTVDAVKAWLESLRSRFEALRTG